MSTITKMKWLQGGSGRFKTRALPITDTRNGYTAYTAAGLCTQSGNMRGHHARISCHLMAHEGGWKDDKEETQGERRKHHASVTGPETCSNAQSRLTCLERSASDRTVRTPS